MSAAISAIITRARSRKRMSRRCAKLPEASDEVGWANGPVSTSRCNSFTAMRRHGVIRAAQLWSRPIQYFQFEPAPGIGPALTWRFIMSRISRKTLFAAAGVASLVALGGVAIAQQDRFSVTV